MTSAIKSPVSKNPSRALVVASAFLAVVMFMTLFLPSLLLEFGHAQGQVEPVQVSKLFLENSTDQVAEFDAVDPENQPIRWQLSGNDSADFVVNEGILSFVIPPDYENAADQNRDNVYEVTVEARDPGFNIAPAELTITVLNIDEDGVVTLSTTRPQQGVRVEVSVTDPDRITSQIDWQWSRSANGVTGWADISGAEEGHYTPVEGDVGQYIRATATYKDAQGGDTNSKSAHGIPANPVVAEPHINRAPEFLDRSPTRAVNENAPDGTPIGNPVAAEDQDNDILTYTLAGTDASSFVIDSATGQVSVGGGVAIDFETKSSYSVTVTATDPSATSDTVTVSISANDVNEPPSTPSGATAINYPENGTGAIQRFTSSDPEGDLLRWTLSGDDAYDFSIVEGVLSFVSSPDFESAADRDLDNDYEVTVSAGDTAGKTSSVDVTVTVTNVDEAGSVTLSSDQPGEGLDISASLADPDGIRGTISWQWARSTDAAAGWVDIPNATSGIYRPSVVDVGHYLQATATYKDAESGTQDKTASKVSDNAVLGGPEVNVAPEFLEDDPASRSVNENAAEGAAVGDPVAAEDRNGDDLTYTLGGDDAGSFSIDAATGQISVGTGTSLDFESQATYNVSVTATDPDGLTDSIGVVISVNNVDEAPAIAADSTEMEYAENGTDAVATFTATDPEGVTSIGWELSGNDSDNFAIAAGVLSFISSPDYENPTDQGVDNIHNVSIGARDATANITWLAVTVTVTNVEEAGTVTLSTGQPTEGVRITAELSDPDYIASRVSWQWARSTDGASWTDIEDATSAIFTPGQADGNHYLRATASYNDREDATATKTASAQTDEAVVAIERPNQPPAFVDSDPTGRSVNENAAVAAPVGAPVSAEDPDDETLVYTLSGVDSDLFDINAATGQITVAEGTALDFESDNSYSVILTVVDPAGASDTIGVLISVTDVDETPTIFEKELIILESRPSDYIENSTAKVATYAVDGTKTEGVVWSINGIDAALFSITQLNGLVELTFNSPPDYENPMDQGRDNEYNITIVATNDEGTMSTLNVVITVANDPNESGESTVARYDLNGDGVIDRSEALQALRNYFNDETTLDQVLAVISRYFAS